MQTEDRGSEINDGQLTFTIGKRLQVLPCRKRCNPSSTDSRRHHLVRLGTFVVVDIGESLLRPLDQSDESPRSRCPSGSESAIRGGL